MAKIQHTRVFSFVRKLPEWLLIGFIQFYQTFISPLFPDSCRFYPTCSRYAIQAIKKYGVVKGLLKSTHRILRCNPFSRGGYDPV